MWRNREIRQQLTAATALCAALVTGGFFLGRESGLLCLAGSALILLVEWRFLKKRYGEIEKLSESLRKICGGEFQLDVRDNEEGELSILKSEIYKVTKMLWEQGDLYKTDQERLAAAIADISHQLKTPLTSMAIMADLLSGPDLQAEKRREFSGRIQAQVTRMNWLLTSLLKMAKIDAGTAVFAEERVFASDLVEQAMEPILIPMDLKKQSISVEGNGRASFIGDINWTAEALLNVMKNCVEHTPEGGRLTITYGENPLFTEIVVADSGKGIAKEDLPYIFQRFYRGKNAGRDSAGIGLAMAQSIVKRQRGELTVESREGEGSSFTFKFYKQII